MNWPTNSAPYGNGGLTAGTILFPGGMTMLPTSSSNDLVGKNVRSATARINSLPVLAYYDGPHIRPGSVSLLESVGKTQLRTVATRRPNRHPRLVLDGMLRQRRRRR